MNNYQKKTKMKRSIILILMTTMIRNHSVCKISDGNAFEIDKKQVYQQMSIKKYVGLLRRYTRISTRTTIGVEPFYQNGHDYYEYKWTYCHSSLDLYKPMTK